MINYRKQRRSRTSLVRHFILPLAGTAILYARWLGAEHAGWLHATGIHEFTRQCRKQLLASAGRRRIVFALCWLVASSDAIASSTPRSSVSRVALPSKTQSSFASHALGQLCAAHFSRKAAQLRELPQAFRTASVEHLGLATESSSFRLMDVLGGFPDLLKVCLVSGRMKMDSIEERPSKSSRPQVQHPTEHCAFGLQLGRSLTT